MNALLLSLLLTPNANAATFQTARHSSPASAEKPSTALYLHLTGADKAADPSSLFAELKKRFEDKLYPLKPSLGFSYVVQTSGGGVFALNLLVEGSTSVLADYLSLTGSDDFHGTPVHFQAVKEIRVLASLEAGNYVADQDDPFDQTYSLERRYSFATFAEMENFSNEYGFALLSPKPEAFLAYLEKFAGDNFKPLRDEVLAKNNMVAIEAAPTLTLEDGTEAGPGWESTPFLPFKFFRNCYSERFENGNCYRGR